MNRRKNLFEPDKEYVLLVRAMGSVLNEIDLYTKQGDHILIDFYEAESDPYFLFDPRLTVVRKEQYG